MPATRLLAIIVIAWRLQFSADACGSGSIARDNEILTDPALSFAVSPPVRWTYYPPVTAATGAQTIANYFPGQSMTSQDAQQAAQNEIMAAYLEAIADSNYPVTGSQLTAQVTYSPDPISNCYTGSVTPPGAMVGYLAGGAITQVALVIGMGGTGVTIVNCPLSSTATVAGIGPNEQYIKPVKVSTRGGVTMTRYGWERVFSQMQSILNFRYHAQFTSPIVIVN